MLYFKVCFYKKVNVVSQNVPVTQVVEQWCPFLRNRLVKCLFFIWIEMYSKQKKKNK